MIENASKERSKNYLHQISGAIVYKAIAMGASFLAVPLMIHYLGQEKFGVWSTLLAVMSWVVFFDLGVGNGLRNKVAESIAKQDQAEAAHYISSGYSLTALIAFLLWAVVIFISFIVPWQNVFNTHSITEASLRLTVQITTSFIVLNFWIGLISAILSAVQKTSMTALGLLISNILALFFVFQLSKTSSASIVYLACSYGISLVAANIILSIWFYRQHPELRPKPHLNKKHINPILSIGMKFFAIQLAALVIFTTDKIFITQIFGPQYVTQYEVVFKLFSLITLTHSLISTPLWSAYTDAYHRGDLMWIKNMLIKQLKIFLVIVGLVALMIALAKPIIEIWIGHEFFVSLPLVFAMGLFVLVSTWNNIYAMFLNGIGEIKLQLYVAVFAMLINIPLIFVFVRYFNFGLTGVVLATCTSLLLIAVALPIQVFHMVGRENKDD